MVLPFNSQGVDPRFGIGCADLQARNLSEEPNKVRSYTCAVCREELFLGTEIACLFGFAASIAKAANNSMKAR